MVHNIRIHQGNFVKYFSVVWNSCSCRCFCPKKKVTKKYKNRSHGHYLRFTEIQASEMSQEISPLKRTVKIQFSSYRVFFRNWTSLKSSLYSKGNIHIEYMKHSLWILLLYIQRIHLIISNTNWQTLTTHMLNQTWENIPFILSVYV